MISETWFWPIFGVVVIVALCLDLFVFQRKAHVIPIKEALKLVAFWAGLALAFNVLLFVLEGHEKGLLFTTCYLIEYSLSVDNLFVFLAVFSYFAVPREAQRRVLLWGILGAVFFRAIFIFAGIAIITRFQFLLYILGAFLVYTAIKLATQKERDIEPDKNPVIKFAKKVFRISPEYNGIKFFEKKNGLRYATPLIIVLLAIETFDLVFATDSVPAVLAVSQDPVIVYTSNIFAILGLRALFFAIAGLFYLFRYLSTGICFVLGFIGLKMLLRMLPDLWGIDFEIPTFVSLAIVLAILLGSVLLSLIFPKKETEQKPAGNESPKQVI